MRNVQQSFGCLLAATILFMSPVLIGCGGDQSQSSPQCFDEPRDSLLLDITQKDIRETEEESVTLVVYDAFLAPEGAFEKFYQDTGITVNVLTTADTGTMVSQASLTSGDPIGDVMFGVDNTFLCRALLNNIFIPYRPSTWDQLNDGLKLDPYERVTPVDYGDICINFWKDAVSDVPHSIDDLRNQNFENTFVTQNPETSAPGMGLFLATIAFYGEDDWEDFWADLRRNGLKVRSGWSESYYGDFVAGGGSRSIVTSYATSPVAEYIFSSEPLASPPTEVIVDSCFRSIEFAGILRGTNKPIASALLIDFLTSQYFQELLPETNFVLPANDMAEIPEVFTEFLPKNLSPISLNPAVIEENRNNWTERWTQIVLR